MPKKPSDAEWVTQLAAMQRTFGVYMTAATSTQPRPGITRARKAHRETVREMKSMLRALKRAEDPDRRG